MKWNLAWCPWFSPDHLRDVSAPWPESVCGKFNLLDMKGTGTVYRRSQYWQCVSEKKAWAMRLKELPAELRDRIVSRHRPGEGYTHTHTKICCVEGSQHHSGLHHWQNHDSSFSWQTEQLREKGLGGDTGDWEPGGHFGWAPDIFLHGNGKEISKRTTITAAAAAALHQFGLYNKSAPRRTLLLSERHMKATWSLQKGRK